MAGPHAISGDAYRSWASSFLTNHEVGMQCWGLTSLAEYAKAEAFFAISSGSPRMHLFGRLLLHYIVVVNATAILRAHIHALPVLCGGIHICKECTQQILVFALLWIIVYLHAWTSDKSAGKSKDRGSHS